MAIYTRPSAIGYCKVDGALSRKEDVDHALRDHVRK